MKVIAVVMVLSGCSLYTGDGQAVEDVDAGAPAPDCGEPPADYGELDVELTVREPEGSGWATMPRPQYEIVTEFRARALEWIECMRER